MLDGGVWIVKRGQKLFYLKDGAFTEIPGITGAQHGQVLRDGNVVIHAAEIYVGLGTGTDRTWIQIRQ